MYQDVIDESQAERRRSIENVQTTSELGVRVAVNEQRGFTS